MDMAGSWQKVVVLLFCLVVFSTTPSSAGGRKLEIKKHLKRLNKRAVKSIKVHFDLFHLTFSPFFFPFPDLIMILQEILLRHAAYVIE